MPGNPVRWLGTGCDLVRISDIRDSVERHGDRYLRRVFHADEIADCAGPRLVPRLAARFAAKEAVVKALRCGDATGPWTEIVVVSAPGGGVSVTLRGGVKAAAEQRGSPTIDVSVSHEGEWAMASAIALAL